MCCWAIPTLAAGGHSGGGSFQKIGRRFGISSDMVALLNPDVNPRRLRVGWGIKVVQGPFNLRVVRSDGRLDLYARDVYVCSYADR